MREMDGFLDADIVSLAATEGCGVPFADTIDREDRCLLGVQMRGSNDAPDATACG